jgi:hypothetical protein
MEEHLEEEFSVEPMTRLHNEDHLPVQQSPETGVRRVGGWCEIVASLRGRKQTNAHCWKALPSSAVKTVTKNTRLCVTVVCKV